ncbi:hypothetical protein ACOTI8_29605 [Achromobacter xylosoxidans]
MTQQDDITQRVRDNATQILDAIRSAGYRDHPTNIERKRVDAILSAVEPLLSKLRAPVADERAAFEAWVKAQHPDAPSMLWRADDTYAYSASEWKAWQARASLASAPVAGEAKNYPGDNVAERLDKMADGQPPGSQAQSDLYAAATIWRKHIAHRAAPQASAVAGEAVTWEAVRQELAIFLMGATGRSSKEWHRPLDNASEGGALARMRACLAAPQASAGQVQAALQKSFDMGKFYGSLPETDAEDVRNAALEQAAAVAKRISDKYAFGLSSIESSTADEIEREILALKTQADKDGGQQRAGDAVVAEALAHLRTLAEFGGTLEQAKSLAARGAQRCAALSATQAGQGERDA